jgi:hypothetical protein
MGLNLLSRTIPAGSPASAPAAVGVARSALTIKTMGRTAWPIRLALAVMAITLATGEATAGLPRAQAIDLPLQTTALTSYSVPGYLYGVSAISVNDAWAVGGTSNGDCDPVTGKTLLLHWNGQRWTAVTSPKPLVGQLYDISVVTANDIWVVGYAGKCAPDPKTLIMHWNGKTWSRQTGVPTLSGWLYSVTATRNTIWAAGEIITHKRGAGLIMHETGGHWYVVPNGLPAGGGFNSVAATGPKAAWAADDLSTDQIYRWNGTVWKPTRLPLSNVYINDVAVISDDQVMADGFGFISPGPESFLWTGSSWRAVPVPSAYTTTLYHVCAASSGGAWVVGFYSNNDNNTETFISHWNGKAWHQVNSPNPVGGGELLACSATSQRNAWAVGSTKSGTLILHWNGKTWS